MTRIRIHELAKELDVKSSDIIRKLNEYGIKKTHHTNSIEMGDIVKLREYYSKSKKTKTDANLEKSEVNILQEAKSDIKQENAKDEKIKEEKIISKQGQDKANAPTTGGKSHRERNDRADRSDGKRNSEGGSRQEHRHDNREHRHDNNRQEQRQENNRQDKKQPPQHSQRGEYANKRQSSSRQSGDWQKRDNRNQSERRTSAAQGNVQNERQNERRPNQSGGQHDRSIQGERRSQYSGGQGERRQGQSNWQDRSSGGQNERHSGGQGERRQSDRRSFGQGNGQGSQGERHTGGHHERGAGSSSHGDRTGRPSQRQNTGRQQDNRFEKSTPDQQGQNRQQYRSGDRPRFQSQFNRERDGRQYYDKDDSKPQRAGILSVKRDVRSDSGKNSQAKTVGKDDFRREFDKKRKFQDSVKNKKSGVSDGQTVSKKTVTSGKDDSVQDVRKRDSYKKDNNQRKPEKKVIPKPVEPEIKLIQLPEILTVKEFAEKIRKSGSEVIKALMAQKMMFALNDDITYEIASKIAEQYDILVEPYVEEDIFEKAFNNEDEDQAKKIERPPVVVVMGHVDHGKTSLLDAIRDTHVTTTEDGGITQRIGAYMVHIDGKPITFLDTPGHEAFTAMRMRGAQVTDIAILVVAADDGVMPQTVEAINHAKAANVEIIVAINKIDKPGANPDRVKQELTEYGILVEEWGGQTISVPVSALKRTGIDQLLEMIILVAEMKELKANPDKNARGTIIEASLDKGRGPVATVLVKEGTLKVGDPIVAGGTFGKIRAMSDDKGKRVKKATPSMPVEILGLSVVPQAGELFYVSNNDKQARILAESIIAKGRQDLVKSTPQKVSLDDLFNQIKSGNVKDLNIVVKADVQGSVEALRESLEKLSNDEVRIRIIHGGVGAVTESDVMLASASNAIIIGFNVRPESQARSVADNEKVDIRLYRVIYSAIEDITAAIKGMLDPVLAENIIGHGNIRQLFKASGVGTIAGAFVQEGKFTRNAKYRIVRDGKTIYEGTIETLKRFKDDVREVLTGYECGLLFTKFNDIKVADVIEAYVIEEVPR